MCTVTLWAGRNGYALGMNRDERHDRVRALPPACRRAGARRALYPVEPGGGTWVGVNDAGVTLALINWYAVSSTVEIPAISRGEVVRRALAEATPDRVAEGLELLPLRRVRAFRMVGVFPENRRVHEWRWSGRGLEMRRHPWQSETWISSGADEPGAQLARGEVFLGALSGMPEEPDDARTWLQRLHRSHLPERGAYSHCVHRPDAGTVSYTEIAVGPEGARMGYAPGPPCCAAPSRTCRLNWSTRRGW